MPTYDYLCKQCNNSFELQHSISEASPGCPECGSVMQKRLLSAPAAHGHMSKGREMAMRALENNNDKPEHGKNCPCCH